MWRLILLLEFAIGCLGAERNVTGDHQHDPYIVGGVDTPSYEARYQLSLEKNGDPICGASVISARWALTAAHCVFSINNPNDIRLRSGSHRLQEGGHLHVVTQIISHILYDFTHKDYDVAVLQVAPYDLFPQKYIIKLSKKRPAVGTFGTVSGWGQLSEDGPSSDSLKWVNVPIIDQAKCTALNTPVSNTITPRMFCAGYPEGGKDSCQGDSGGPLVVGEFQVGIVSKGHGCARPQGGVYTDVAQVRGWISRHTGVE